MGRRPEQRVITALLQQKPGHPQGEIAALDEQLEQLVDEYGGEGGALEQALDDRGKLSKKSVTARLKETEGFWQDEEGDADEPRLLGEVVEVLERQSAAKARLKAAEASLNSGLASAYAAMDAQAISGLVIDHKWVRAIQDHIEALCTATTRVLAARVNELAARYAEPLPKIESDIAALDQQVTRHLDDLGAWKD